MIRTNYARGRAFEYRVRDDLKKRGYILFRSAGSHSIADLIAFNTGTKVLFVQCKRNGAMPPAERTLFAKEAQRCNVTAVLASGKKRGTLRYERIGRGGTRTEFTP